VAAAPAPVPYDFTENYRKTVLREKNNLPYQITGLVAGYVATVLIWGILLLTVGRRMRRKTENSPKTLELELVTKRPEERLKSPIPASPSSARSATSWFKKGFRKDKPASIQEEHSPQSPASFDQAVLDADRARAQDEMERLYAAVMDHDRKKSMSQASDDGFNSRRPSAINTSNDHTSHSNPSSPMKAVYPPNFSHNGPPTAPLPSSHHSYRRPSFQHQEPASPRSVLSKKSATSSSSKTRFNLKNLRISGPIAKYPNDRDDDARTPLSPRFYNPGAPPSPPTQQNSPTTPAEIEEAYERLDAVQPLPRPAPQRTISISSSNAPTPTTTSAPPLNQQPRSAASSNTNLPLRGYAEPLRSPDLRTTVLDRRVDRLGMTSPRTGVPFTPYSPYMPFTPITPVTPHLVTKRERKAAKKYEGRGVPSGRDMVQSPKEIFGDAW
ncbi:hypothetical protein DM02DRAFT_477843, partial [Periconia macrospinosa]